MQDILVSCVALQRMNALEKNWLLRTTAMRTAIVWDGGRDGGRDGDWASTYDHTSLSLSSEAISRHAVDFLGQKVDCGVINTQGYSVLL